MSQINQTYPFRLTPLPYTMNALKPSISEFTLYYHHDKHFNSYVNDLNKTLEDYPEYQTWTLEELLLNNTNLPEHLQTPIRKYAGGVYNHEMYFNSMEGNRPVHTRAFASDTPLHATVYSPSKDSALSKELSNAFGSFEDFIGLLKKAAEDVFGSGYAWLVLCPDSSLSIVTSNNQDNPLLINCIPLLTIDVWEHSYYLDYQNRRTDYINQWEKLVNWDYVNDRLIQAKSM